MLVQLERCNDIVGIPIYDNLKHKISKLNLENTIGWMDLF